MAKSTDWQYQPTSNITSGQESTPYGSLTGATPSYYSAEYGGIAQTPDPNVSAYQAIQGNLSNSGQLANLANYWNQFNQQQMINQYNAVNPYYSNSMAQAGANAYDYLQGIIPQDVINQLGQQAAERGTQTGLGAGSANVSSALLRALGLTSLDLQQTGLNDLSTIYKDTPTVSLFDTTPYMTTASDIQAAQTAANKNAAAGIPYYVAQANLNAAKAGQTAGASAAGSTPQVVGGSANPWQTYWNTGGTTAGAAGGGSGVGVSNQWWQPQTNEPSQSVYDWWNSAYGGDNMQWNDYSQQEANTDWSAIGTYGTPDYSNPYMDVSGYA